MRIEADLFDGSVFDPRYVRRYGAYLRNPTRVPPPLPREYPCVRCCVYEKGRAIAQVTQDFPAGTLTASVDGRGVAVGPNRMVQDGGDALSLELSSSPAPGIAPGQRNAQAAPIAVSLSLSPPVAQAPVERVLIPREVSGAEHHWIIARPLCDVEGVIHVGAGGAEERTISFRGLGYHDQYYGTGPLVTGLRHWMWGRVLTEARAITFNYAVPLDAAMPVAFHALEADARGTRAHEHPRPPEIRFQRRGPGGVDYPEILELGEGVVLKHPAVLDASSPFRVALSYDVTGAGENATALCHAVSPQRLASPMFRRIIDRVLSRRGRDT